MGELFHTPLILLDAGAREWRCGFSDEDGPAVILPGPSAGGGFPAWKEKLSNAIEALEAEPPEQAVVLSERPGTSTGAREAMANALFTDHGAAALWTVAGPLLALFNSGRDTAVLVDVGERATHILLVYDGHDVLEVGAAVHPLAGGHLPNSGGDASCDGLFDPSVLDQEESNKTDATIGVHEAVLKCVSLADVSLRKELLANIVLVGGATRLADFPQRFQTEIEGLLAASQAPWKPNVIANADRRIANWMGAAGAVAVPSCQLQFLRKDEYERGPDGKAELHKLSGKLSSKPLSELDVHFEAAAKAEAAAYLNARHASRRECAEAAKLAYVWWTQHNAPAKSAVELERMRKIQTHIVRGMYERAIRQQVLGLLEQLPGGRRPSREDMAIAAPAASIAEDGSLHGGSRFKEAAPEPPHGPLAFAASALRLLAGKGRNDELIASRISHLLAAEWAVSDMNLLVDERRIVKHFEGGEKKRALGLWKRLLRKRELARSRTRQALKMWVRHGEKTCLARWWTVRLVSLLSSQRKMQGRLQLLSSAFGHRWRRFSIDKKVQKARMYTAKGKGFGVLVVRAWHKWVDECIVNGVVLKRRAERRQGISLARHLCRVVQKWAKIATGNQPLREVELEAMVRTRKRLRVKFWRRLLECVHNRRQSLACAQKVAEWKAVRSVQRRGGVGGALRKWENEVEGAMKQRTRLAAAAKYNLEKKYGEGIEKWCAHVHYEKVVRRARLRRTAAKVRRGLKASRAATLRRGMRGFGRCVAVEILHRRTLELRFKVRSSSERRRQVAAVQLWFEKAKMGVIVDKHNEKMAPTRNARDLKAALSYWSAEATWRIERQRWMWRQVRYMHELQAVLDQAGDGQRLARRLLSVGVEPHAGSQKSEQQLRAGKAAISRSTAALERVLRRDSSPRRGSSVGDSENYRPPRESMDQLSPASVRAAATAQRRRAAGLRVLAPDIDSYLEEYTPKTRTTGVGGMQAMSMSDRSARRSMTGRMTGAGLHRPR